MGSGDSEVGETGRPDGRTVVRNGHLPGRRGRKVPGRLEIMGRYCLRPAQESGGVLIGRGHPRTGQRDRMGR